VDGIHFLAQLAVTLDFFFLIWRKKPRIFSHEIMELVGV